MANYYDVTLQKKRHVMLLQHHMFSANEGMLEDINLICPVADEIRPNVIVHLAGQAGVRYSLENPRSYKPRTSWGRSTWRKSRGDFRCGTD